MVIFSDAISFVSATGSLRAARTAMTTVLLYFPWRGQRGLATRTHQSLGKFAGAQFVVLVASGEGGP